MSVKRGPLFRSEPPRARTFGDIAADVGRDLGLAPDPEQQWLLDAMYGESSPGLPSAYEVCVVGPRQTVGKSATLEIAALTDLFVVGVELAVWTAHEFKTARKSFEDMRRRILRHSDYAVRASFRDSHGEEAIYLDTGERLEFHARSGGSGRGFTCSRLTLDEAMYLQPGDLGALVPTMVTIPDAQIRYGSSAGKEFSAALRALRERGRAGGDPSLAYAEYGAEFHPCESESCTHQVGTAGCALDDRELWWQGSCALWVGRATEDAVAKQRQALPPEEFAREFLSWWEDPPEGSAARVIDMVAWDAAKDATRQMALAPVAFGVTVSPDRSRTLIGVAGHRDDGRVQVELVADGRGAAWAVDWLALRCATWGPCAVVLDGLAASLQVPLEERGVPVVPTSTPERAQATAGFYDAFCDGRVRHPGEPLLDDAARRAGKRAMAAGFVWDGPKVGPLVAVTLAYHGLVVHGVVKPPAAPPVLVRTGVGRSETADLASASF